ncbi:TetR family transcriptional regulator [Blastococcus sp. SYSU DS0533]
MLDASAKVFARQGYEGTSIDDIADELQNTKGRVYHYYRSKAELLIGVVKKGTSELLEEVRPVASDDSVNATERLRRMAHTHAMKMMTSHAYQFVTLRHLNHRFDDAPAREREAWNALGELRDEYESLFSRVIEDGRASGEFVVADVRNAVRAMLGALNWITVWYRPDPSGAVDPVVAGRIADSITRFCVAGVREEL